MARWLRPPFALVALVAVFAASGLVASAGTVTGDQEEQAAVARSAGRSAPAERLPRLPGAAIVLAVSVTVAVLGRRFSAASNLVGRFRRRIGDVGDDWRSLLFGAPPALA